MAFQQHQTTNKHKTFIYTNRSIINTSIYSKLCLKIDRIVYATYWAVYFICILRG